jgi:hypothetical protein
LLNHINVSY